MKIVILSWHPGNTNLLISGGYTRFFEIAKRSPFPIHIIDTYPSLYRKITNKNIHITEYGRYYTFPTIKKFSPVLAKILNRYLSILTLTILLLSTEKKGTIIYVPYSENLEVTIPAIVMKWVKGNKVILCNLNVNTIFLDRPINVFLHRFADKIITLSKDLQKDLAASGIEADEVNGVGFDKPNIKPKMTNSKSKKEYDAIYVGRHIPQKGIFDLIEIWNLLINKYHTLFRLVTLGDIPGYMKPKIQNKLKMYKLENYFLMKGSATDKEKQKLLQTSKLMVFPSRQEGWGIAPMEALSYQLPVIAYNLSIYSESIGPTKAFRTVRVGDYEQFTRIIIDTLHNNKYYSTYTKKWEPVATWENVAKKEWEIIERVAKREVKNNE